MTDVVHFALAMAGLFLPVGILPAWGIAAYRIVGPQPPSDFVNDPYWIPALIGTVIEIVLIYTIPPLF